MHEQGRGVEADHLDHAECHAEGGRQGGAPARRRRQRHRRQDGSRGFPGGSAGDAGHEVPSRRDGDPHAHDSGAAAAGAGQAQPRRHPVEVEPPVYASDAEVNIVKVSIVCPDGKSHTIKAYKEEASTLREFIRTHK